MVSIALGVLLLVAGVGYAVRLVARRVARQPPALDDAAMREIERTGQLAGRDPADDVPLDAEEIDAAEEEFWGEGWDEAEEYDR